MAIFRDDSTEEYEFAAHATTYEPVSTATSTISSVVPLIRAKLLAPTQRHAFGRTALTDLLTRYSINSAATLLVGRAGAGKTTLASEIVAQTADHSWYSIDSSDADWNSFQRYFRAALTNIRSACRKSKEDVDESGFSSSPIELFADLTADLELNGMAWPSLIVMDGVHHLFDCPWFDDFFTLLITSLPHSSHVLLLSRSRPSTPVWRMRSKQALNVIDEKTLAFSLAETKALFAKHGLDADAAVTAHRESFGRPSELIEYIWALQTAPSRHSLSI